MFFDFLVFEKLDIPIFSGSFIRDRLPQGFAVQGGARTVDFSGDSGTSVQGPGEHCLGVGGKLKLPVSGLLPAECRSTQIQEGCLFINPPLTNL